MLEEKILQVLWK